MTMHFAKSKRLVRNLPVALALMNSVIWMLDCPVTAQTFTNLHNFAFADGTYPYGGLILFSNTLYGTAENYGGGPGGGFGTVFKVNTDGTSFTNLHTLNGGSEGAYPHAGLVLSDNTLYGTAAEGGSSSAGVVFKINTDGSGFTNIYSFTAPSGSYPYTNSDGAYPLAGLIVSGNTVYGTAQNGGIWGYGTVFKLNTDGSGFTNLYSFSGGNDGGDPAAGLVLSGNTLYGTAEDDGRYLNGTVFTINTDGTDFTNLYSFAGSDGGSPVGGLVLEGNTLYGTTVGGGSASAGTVFAINTDGSSFSNLYSFMATTGPYPYTNIGGANPVGGVILYGNTLYGTTEHGGDFGHGTLFAVNTNGSGFATLYSFTAFAGASTNNDGAYPYAGLILSGDTLYGTTTAGGGSGDGTLFSFLILPQLTIFPAGTNVVLTWAANAAGFTLQSNTNLILTATWNSVSPPPVVVNGRNAVTNNISAPQRFYRLSR